MQTLTHLRDFSIKVLLDLLSSEFIALDARDIYWIYSGQKITSFPRINQYVEIKCYFTSGASRATFEFLGYRAGHKLFKMFNYSIEVIATGYFWPSLSAPDPGREARILQLFVSIWLQSTLRLLLTSPRQLTFAAPSTRAIGHYPIYYNNLTYTIILVKSRFQ